jgi:hypothetical protein
MNKLIKYRAGQNYSNTKFLYSPKGKLRNIRKILWGSKEFSFFDGTIFGHSISYGLYSRLSPTIYDLQNNNNSPDFTPFQNSTLT